MNPNVDFYEKMKELQGIQHSSEEKRTELEQQLNTYVRSDARLAKLKAVRLQSYWKKICEDERKSQWRNDQLMHDFERVEAHMVDLNARTEKLRTMKKSFEDHVERQYPNWKEKVLYYQRLRQHQETLDHNREAEELRRATVSAMNAQNTTAALFSQPQQPQIAVNGYAESARSQPPPQVQISQSYAHYQVPYSHQSHVTAQDNGHQPHNMSQYESQPVATGVYEGGSTIPTLSSLPTGTGLSTGFSGHSIQATSTPHPGHQVDPRQQQLQYSRIEHNSGRKDYDRIEEESTQSQQAQHSRSPRPHSGGSQRQHKSSPRQQASSPRQPSASPRSQSKQQQHLHQSMNSDTRDTTQTPTTQITQKQVNSFMEPADAEGEVYSYRSNPKTPSPRTPRDYKQDAMDKTDELDDDSEFGSVEDLPISVSETQNKQVKSPEPNVQQSLDSSRSIYASAEVTLSGLYSILSTLSEHMDSAVTRSLYKGDRPAQSVQTEIIGNANRGSLLNYMDSTSLSMVVLDQLPLLCASTDDQCILPDSILFKFPPVISESAIREKVSPTSRIFWEKLLEHFVCLAKHRVMGNQEMAEIFAPLIIANDSPYESKAIELVSKLLDECVPVDFASPNSTSTFSATPRRVPQVLQKNSDEDEDDEEDFFAKEPPKETSTAALTQSAAYRQMLGSTVSTQKSVSYIDSEDDDDENDIEKQVLSPRPGSGGGSSLKKPEPSSGTASPRVPASPSRDGALSPASFGSGMSSPVPKSPMGPSGYVPSATLGDTGRSVPGQSTMSSLGSTGKKPAFMYGGDSDTDEDIDLPGNDNRNDDFDFYD